MHCNGKVLYCTKFFQCVYIEKLSGSSKAFGKLLPETWINDINRNGLEQKKKTEPAKMKSGGESEWRVDDD